MKKAILSIAIAVFSVHVSSAEDLYFAQSSAGDNSASSCANAQPMSSVVWGSGAWKVGAGDTLHLCGTITEGFTVGASGSAGSPITIKWEDNAKMSAANWAAARPITISGKTNLVIDGGTNGIIEATDTGTGLGSQVGVSAIYVTGNIGNIEVKNLNIRNLFVRTPGTNLGDFSGYGIQLYSATGDNVLIHNDNITYAARSITIDEMSLTGVKIYNNSLTHSTYGIEISNTTNGKYFHDAEIYGNTIILYDDASTNPCNLELYHSDGIHAWHYNGATMDNVSFYGNTFGPDMACIQASGYLFLEGTSTNILIYNNIFLGGTKPMQNGLVFLKSNNAAYTHQSRVYNNTFTNTVAGANNTGITTRLLAGSSVDIQNNIFSSLYQGIQDDAGNVDPTNNNNLYYNMEVAKTTNTALDVTYYEGDPLLDANYAPQAGSPAIDNGADLSAYFLTDFLGNTRSAPWDIGAYESGAADSTPSAFTFIDNTGVALSTVIYSTSVTVAGIDNTTAISLSGAGCEYRVNAGSWITSGDNVSLNDNVALRTASSGSYNTAVSCVLTMGGVSDTWSVTTAAAVEVPESPRMRCGSMTGGWK